jgi:hypothetical protein
MSKRIARLVKRKGELAVIGWREWVGLPDLGIAHIKTKVDTGARSSSLHVVGLEHLEKDGVKYVRFKIHPAQRSAREVVQAEAEVLEYRSVRSSSGRASLRPVIVTSVALLGDVWKIEVTLANRDEMGFRMLLGRESFRNRFLVDAGTSYYGIKPKTKKKLKKTVQNETSNPIP